MDKTHDSESKMSCLLESVFGLYPSQASQFVAFVVDILAAY